MEKVVTIIQIKNGRNLYAVKNNDTIVPFNQMHADIYAKNTAEDVS